CAGSVARAGDLAAARLGRFADDLTAGQLAAGQRRHDAIGVAGRDVQVGVRVHDVDGRQQHLARVRGDEVADVALGRAVLATQVQVETGDVVGRRVGRRRRAV